MLFPSVDSHHQDFYTDSLGLFFSKDLCAGFCCYFSVTVMYLLSAHPEHHDFDIKYIGMHLQLSMFDLLYIFGKIAVVLYLLMSLAQTFIINHGQRNYYYKVCVCFLGGTPCCIVCM